MTPQTSPPKVSFQQRHNIPSPSKYSLQTEFSPIINIVRAHRRYSLSLRRRPISLFRDSETAQTFRGSGELPEAFPARLTPRPSPNHQPTPPSPPQHQDFLHTTSPHPLFTMILPRDDDDEPVRRPSPPHGATHPPQIQHGPAGLSAGAIAGIVLAVLIVLLAIGWVVRYSSSRVT